MISFAFSLSIFFYPFLPPPPISHYLFLSCFKLLRIPLECSHLQQFFPFPSPSHHPPTTQYSLLCPPVPGAVQHIREARHSAQQLRSHIRYPHPAKTSASQCSSLRCLHVSSSRHQRIICHFFFSFYYLSFHFFSYIHARHYLSLLSSPFLSFSFHSFLSSLPFSPSLPFCPSLPFSPQSTTRRWTTLTW